MRLRPGPVVHGVAGLPGWLPAAVHGIELRPRRLRRLVRNLHRSIRLQCGSLRLPARLHGPVLWPGRLRRVLRQLPERPILQCGRLRRVHAPMQREELRRRRLRRLVRHMSSFPGLPERKVRLRSLLQRPFMWSRWLRRVLRQLPRERGLHERLSLLRPQLCGRWPEVRGRRLRWLLWHLRERRMHPGGRHLRERGLSVRSAGGLLRERLLPRGVRLQRSAMGRLRAPGSHLHLRLVLTGPRLRLRGYPGLARPGRSLGCEPDGMSGLHADLPFDRCDLRTRRVRRQLWQLLGRPGLRQPGRAVHSRPLQEPPVVSMLRVRQRRHL